VSDFEGTTRDPKSVQTLHGTEGIDGGKGGLRQGYIQTTRHRGVERVVRPSVPVIWPTKTWQSCRWASVATGGSRVYLMAGYATSRLIRKLVRQTGPVGRWGGRPLRKQGGEKRGMMGTPCMSIAYWGGTNKLTETRFRQETEMGTQRPGN